MFAARPGPYHLRVVGVPEGPETRLRFFFEDMFFSAPPTPPFGPPGDLIAWGVMSNSVTPMMKQYQEAKRACPEAILLFRMGDFYELFYEDAKTAARTVNLALTSREKGENAVPMAGFPHHQLESYLGKLIAAGFRVAV